MFIRLAESWLIHTIDVERCAFPRSVGANAPPAPETTALAGGEAAAGSLPRKDEAEFVRRAVYQTARPPPVLIQSFYAALASPGTALWIARR